MLHINTVKMSPTTKIIFYSANLKFRINIDEVQNNPSELCVKEFTLHQAMSSDKIYQRMEFLSALYSKSLKILLRSSVA